MRGVYAVAGAQMADGDWYAQMMRGSWCMAWAYGETEQDAVSLLRMEVMAWVKSDDRRKAALACIKEYRPCSPIGSAAADFNSARWGFESPRGSWYLKADQGMGRDRQKETTMPNNTADRKEHFMTRTLTYTPGPPGQKLHACFGVTDERYQSVCEKIDATMGLTYGETIMALNAGDWSDAEWTFALFILGQIKGIAVEREKQLARFRPYVDELEASLDEYERPHP